MFTLQTLIWTWSNLLVFALGTHAAPYATPPTENSTQPLVHLRNGTLAGVYNQQYRQDYFLGIPYAEPPIGDRRFRRPSPPVAWDGVKPAVTYGPACFGNPLGLIGFSLNETRPMSEDCLHVNVVRPAGTTEATRLPVLAWIHGGNWQDGSTGEARYNGSFLVQRSVEMNSPIMFVSFNYRLGVFGLIAGQAAERANLTNLLQHDQRQALRWVQENIAQFGGDRERVTIMGESSGAGSIGFHLLAYGGRDEGLFHSAIAQSGGPLSVNPFPNITQREDNFNTLLNITNCSAATDAIACLRTVPASLLRMASSQVQFYFTVDGDLLPDRNSQLLQSGRFLKVPLLIGVNRNEATTMIRSSLSTPLDTDKDFMEFAQAVVGVNVMPPGVLENLTVLYQDEIDNPSNGGLGTVLADPGPAYGSAYGKTTLWFGDYLLGAGRRYSAQVWAENNVPSYSYFFDTVPASLDPQTFGAAHGQEIPFAFCNTDGVGWDVDPFPADSALKQKYDELAIIMSSMWISFAATKSPNLHKGLCVPALYPRRYETRYRPADSGNQWMT